MDNKEKNKNRPLLLYVALGFLIFFGVQQYNENTNAPESVSFTEFKLLITENKVTEAVIKEQLEIIVDTIKNGLYSNRYFGPSPKEELMKRRQ